MVNTVVTFCDIKIPSMFRDTVHISRFTHSDFLHRLELESAKALVRFCFWSEDYSRSFLFQKYVWYFFCSPGQNLCLYLHVHRVVKPISYILLHSLFLRVSWYYNSQITWYFCCVHLHFVFIVTLMAKPNKSNERRHPSLTMGSVLHFFNW